MKLNATGIMTLLSDFGESDWYVSAMKGIILTRCPSCRLVDITHQIPPGDIWAGAYVLKEAYRYFPSGTVHLAVVDPGVGGARRPLMVEAGEHWFVGPDNGLLSPTLQTEGGGIVRHIRKEELFIQPLSSTFHGRDLFAPIAAYLASGGNPSTLGPEVEDWVRLEMPPPRFGKDEVLGQIIHVDRFGTGISNIRGEHLFEYLAGGDMEVRVGGRNLGTIQSTYMDVPRGQPLALIGSSGFVEISIHGGNAQVHLGLEPNRTSVSVRSRNKG